MGRFFAFLLGVAGALIGSQGPGFTLQYMQALQSAVDTLEISVAEMDEQLAIRGLTRSQAVAECERSTSKVLDAYCEEDMIKIARLEMLTTHLAELEAAGDYVRPLILARTYDRQIFDSTRKQFEPAVPATVHGAVYAAGGFAVLWGLSAFLFGVLGAMFGARRYA